jgi:RND family efflux transporter MFP subunit
MSRPKMIGNAFNNFICRNGECMNFKMTRNKVKIAVVILVLLVLFHSFSGHKTIALPPTKVIVQKPQWGQVTEYVTQTGTLVAYNSVDLVARVEGYLDAITFIDGSIVKKGSALFVIQPEPYMENLKSAQANVLVEKANYAYATSEYARQKRMYKQNATSLNSVEIWDAKTQEAEGKIAEAEANEINAEITYSYTHISAPFDGRIGRHLVDIGNLVGNGVATNLATIEQINPIYVYFNLNELDLIKLRTAAMQQGLQPSDIMKIPVYVKLQTETTFKHQGFLNFVNTGLNASTGTMELRALLNNDDLHLLPGLFVQVRIPVSRAKNELTLPDDVVLYDQIGAYVLTVDANNIVQTKRIEVGTVDQGKRSITKGLNAKDNVIIGGLQFATPGNKVEIQQ